ncbi:hypothetical protein GCM10017600_64920 [Streptosporangium carneum]|uniref:Uncharacterized protein n=1 Tax=Streptosporangium carneum TaxID=47481 RepID=A0A9W6I6R0_9ACTN|nr:hypothetical protein GCM10017600_64920 [Streptosporangium carneum]
MWDEVWKRRFVPGAFADQQVREMSPLRKPGEHGSGHLTLPGTGTRHPQST